MYWLFAEDPVAERPCDDSRTAHSISTDRRSKEIGSVDDNHRRWR